LFQLLLEDDGRERRVENLMFTFNKHPIATPKIDNIPKVKQKVNEMTS